MIKSKKKGDEFEIVIDRYFVKGGINLSNCLSETGVNFETGYCEILVASINEVI